MQEMESHWNTKKAEKRNSKKTFLIYRLTATAARQFVPPEVEFEAQIVRQRRRTPASSRSTYWSATSKEDCWLFGSFVFSEWMLPKIGFQLSLICSSSIVSEPIKAK